GRGGGRAVLGGPARPDEGVLRALVALDLGVLECRPVRLLLAEACDIFLHDVLEGNPDQFRRTLMPCNAHGSLLLKRRKYYAESMLSWRNASMKRAGRHGLDRNAASLAWRLRELPDASGRERKF